MSGPPIAPGRLREVGLYFLRLGFIAFGGPAAHIALMRRELVAQRKWVSDAEFVDMLGVTNLIPGPNSTEMTMHLGGQRAGWRGLWLAGAAFILPAVAVVLVLAWAYERYGDTPGGEALILGIQPVILAVVVQAIWGLRGAAIRSVETAVVGLCVLLLAVVDVNEVILILGAGLVMMALHHGLRLLVPRRHLLLAPLAGLPPLSRLVDSPPGYSVLELFLVFLKIGAVLYGSGYVLVAFLQEDFVDHRHWLTEQQLIDAIAVGQFTPGPVFSSATFVGYLVGGFPGAGAATLGIFLPSFVLVALTRPLVPKIRGSKLFAPFLDGVNVAALVVMGVVTIGLARNALDSAFTAGLFAIAVAVLLRLNPSSAWLVLGGVVAGIAHQLVT